VRSSYAIQKTPQYGILSEDQINEIHRASLEILWRTGSRIFCDEALALLKKAGADLTDGNLVRIPPHLVEWALQTAPKRVPVANRDGERVMFLEDSRTYYGTGSDCPNIRDSNTGERRKFLKEDIAAAARVCDAMPNIDFVMSMGLASDVPEATSDRHQFEAMLLNTRKPIVFTAHDLDGLRDIVSMAAAVRGGIEELRRNPFLILYAEPVTPLKHSQEAVEKLLFMAENYLPVIYAPGMLAGGTAPVTIAGCLALANAESLSGLVMAQLKRAGAPVIYGGGALPLDMRTSNPAYGSPELQLAGSALAAMAHHYRLPRFSGAGASDSKVLDQQAAVEGTVSVMMQALSGANLVHDVGYLESGLTGSYEMVVLMDEVISLVKFILNGIEISDETLALDVIHHVGPGGNFIAEDHTLKNFRKGWLTRMMDRKNYDSWASDGQETMMDRLSKRVKGILTEYKPKPLPESVSRELGDIIKTAEKKFAAPRS
jgi:trimethylamine---corrinoid protein Co-methyltransferase